MVRADRLVDAQRADRSAEAGRDEGVVQPWPAGSREDGGSRRLGDSLDTTFILRVAASQEGGPARWYP